MTEIKFIDNKMNFFYDNLDVEHGWQQNTFVDWYSGKSLTADDKPNLDDSYYTHCSAFVASAACRLNVPILCPPEHRTEGLANAQLLWLNKIGINKGWIKLKSSIDAQIEANKNNFVIMCCHNKNDPNGGHIACVRPFNTTEKDIINKGPRICQAGVINSSSIDAHDVFVNHDCEYWMYSL